VKVADKKVVDPAAIREVARKFAAEDGPRAFLKNAAKKLGDARLPEFALTFMGTGTVHAHNDVADRHRDNLTTGAHHLTAVSEALFAVAANWDKSDQPWVIR
jgi:hypothetical protein